MEQIVNLSDYDRNLLTSVLESNRRIAEALERRNEESEILYTCSQAAAYLSKDKSTISRMLADGRLHKVYRGRLSGISKSELDKYK